MPLKDEFRDRLKQSIKLAKERGYPPIIFEAMMKDPVNAVRSLLLPTRVQTGMVRMAEIGLVHTESVEAIIVKEPKWAALFDPEEYRHMRNEARRRLDLFK
jgi:hypothetical protein